MQSNEGYFALDTRNADVHDFVSLDDLERFARHPIKFVNNFSFHSTVGLSARRRWRLLEVTIAFGPPLIVFILLFTSLLRAPEKAAQ